MFSMKKEGLLALRALWVNFSNIFGSQFLKIHQLARYYAIYLLKSFASYRMIIKIILL